MSSLPISTEEIARRLKEPIHRVRYALKAHGPPARGKVGWNKYWLAADLPAIKQSLRTTAKHRPGVQRGRRNSQR